MQIFVRKLMPLTLMLLLALGACSAGQGAPEQTVVATQGSRPSATLLPVATSRDGEPLASPTPGSPVASATPVVEGTPSGEAQDDPAALQAGLAGALARDPLALAVAFRGVEADVGATPEPQAEIGSVESFWVQDLNAGAYYSVTAELLQRSEHLEVYAVTGATVDREALARSLETFEQKSLGGILKLFDNQVEAPRITMLLASLPGAAGYYSLEDEVPSRANPYSNDRPMIYMNIDALQPGGTAFDSTLAHEVQHLLHQRLQQNSATWFNEGASMLTELLLGFPSSSTASTFVQQPDTQLNAWAASPSASLAHYGGAQLFLAYIYTRLGNQLPLAELARQDAGDQLDIFPRLTGHADLGDLIADWSIANLINDSQAGDGRYAYPQLPSTVQPAELAPEQQASVHQLAADSWLIPPSGQEQVLRFAGASQAALTAAPLEPGERGWWSGRGDSRVSTLVRELDLRDRSEATLSYKLWFELEEGYDYAFVAASRDGGKSWRTLRGLQTSDANPQGLSYGDGYTGSSAELGAGWLDEQVDLSEYLGEQIQLGFWAINDQAYNATGLVVKDLQLDGQPLEGGWQGRGFIETSNRLPQSWELRLVQLAPEHAVSTIAVEQGRAEIRVPAGSRAVLLVIATSPATTEPASYTIAR